MRVSCFRALGDSASSIAQVIHIYPVSVAVVCRGDVLDWTRLSSSHGKNREYRRRGSWVRATSFGSMTARSFGDHTATHVYALSRIT